MNRRGYTLWKKQHNRRKSSDRTSGRSPSRTHLAYGRRNGTAREVDAETGKSILTCTFGTENLETSQLVWSPNSSYIALVGVDNHGRIDRIGEIGVWDVIRSKRIFQTSFQASFRPTMFSLVIG